VRRHVIREIQENLIKVAPAPSLRRVIALDDRMARRSKMCCCMLAWRAVAASYVAATAAQAKVYPSAACLETFLASQRARRHNVDGGGVAAFVSDVRVHWISFTS
jgi:hypothetical protein